jgi:iron complex transport system substrate-binding protein
VTRNELTSGLAASACVVFAIAVMGYDPSSSTEAPDETNAQTRPDLDYVRLPGGQRGLVDATGHAVPLERYERIAAGSIASRSALGELCEHERIAAVISAGIEDAPNAHRFAGVPRVADIKDTEQMLSLRVDLVIVNSIGSLSHVARLRAAGLEVFALGPMRGVDTFVRDLRQVAALIGHPERGDQVAIGFRRRLHAVADDIEPRRRRQGMYLTSYGNTIFGGTAGTSYHDILIYGGLIDAAAARFHGWPQYSVEHVLSIDPEFIVAPAGTAASLCQKQPLGQLRACSEGRSGFVELPSSWLEDPSLIMLDVAEEIRERVYGPRREETPQ